MVDKTKENRMKQSMVTPKEVIVDCFEKNLSSQD